MLGEVLLGFAIDLLEGDIESSHYLGFMFGISHEIVATVEEFEVDDLVHFF